MASLDLGLGLDLEYELEKNWKNWYYALIFAPLGLSWLIAMVTWRQMRRMRNGIEKVRPPPIVFVIVWTILYLAFGTAWAFAHMFPQRDQLIYGLESQSRVVVWVVFSFTVFCLEIWPLVWAFVSARMALYVLILSLLGSFMCYTISPLSARICINPLIVWLLFAMNLNYTYVLKN
jgi:hypothetical protein